MILTIGIYLIVILLFLNFIAGCGEKEVIVLKEYLKPIDLEKSGFKLTVFQEIFKCEEEDGEFYTAIIKDDYNNAIEEFWDSTQTKLNVMAMMNISTTDIYDGLLKHKKKMKKRGYIFKG